MQQQEEGLSMRTENAGTHDLTREDIKDAPPSDVPDDVGKGYVIEPPSETTEDEVLDVETIENGNEDPSSDSPTTRSKTQKQGLKNKNTKQEKHIEQEETNMESELRQDNGFSETEGSDVPVPPSDNLKEMVVEEEEEAGKEEGNDPHPDETNGSDESGISEYKEVHVENERKESDQEVVEEDISVTEISYEENNQQERKCSETSEKYLLSLSSSEVHSFSHSFNKRELSEDNEFNPEKFSVSGSSWGGNIRSISARRPMRETLHFVVQSRSSISVERAGTEENFSDTYSSAKTTEDTMFASLKRKIGEIDTSYSKKPKVLDSKNSKFFSMVSSPLRVLKRKFSDRIVEGPQAQCSEDIANCHKDNESFAKIQIDNNELKEKDDCVVANEVTNQSTLYRNWCSLM